MKKSLQKEISNDPIQNLIDDYVSRPKIYGAKLLGAGGGATSFLLENPRLYEHNNKNGIFSIENSGSSIVFNDN